MIWRWRLKSPAMITFSPPSHSPLLHFAILLRQLKAPRIVTLKNHCRPNHLGTENSSDRLPKNTFLSPQIVLATLQNCSSDIIALSFFLWYGNVKRILDELETVGCVRKPQTLLLLMRIYWCGAMYDMVLEAFEEMRNYGYIQIHMRATLLWMYCSRLGMLRGPQEYVDKGYYMNPETYTLVMNCFCKFARLEEALQLLGMMMVLGLHVSVNWSILIDGFCKSGQIEVAAYFLEKMVKIGCSPNIVTCTSLIKGFLESRMPGKAFEILGTLESQGCFPDLVLCNVLIDCLSKMGWYHSAFEVFSSLRELRLMPDVYTFSSLVSTICLSRQYVLLPLLTSGLAIQPDLVVCNCLLSYFHKAGYPNGAVKFYNDMMTEGFYQKYSFAGVLSALCRLGRTNEAFNVYQGIIRSYPGADAHIHTIMINELIKSGSFHKATRLFRKAAAEKLPLDVVSYNVAIHGLIRGGQMEEAFALFNQMKEMDVLPNKHSYNMILSGFCRNRNINMVKHLLQEMVDGLLLELEIWGVLPKIIGERESVALIFQIWIERCCPVPSVLSGFVQFENGSFAKNFVWRWDCSLGDPSGPHPARPKRMTLPTESVFRADKGRLNYLAKHSLKKLYGWPLHGTRGSGKDLGDSKEHCGNLRDI
ncbi:UNVERIFIED_CONTAM: putative pentatricopeptide repeat-containing protein [Sesamum calycinum]|uniref:Pentatricopeptide repeat-containing protein n=1 Tax=Sesamum calycinum TaxID=2727403 RepID=A0AAW2JZW1_9LAMI